MLAKVTSIKNGVIHVRANNKLWKIYSLDTSIVNVGDVIDCEVITGEGQVFLQPTGTFSSTEEWERQEG